MSKLVYNILIAIVIIAVIGSLIISCDAVAAGDGDAYIEPADAQLALDTQDIPTVATVPMVDWRGCSGKMQDHPCNFTLMDQHGNNWRLYDHVGNIIVLDLSTVWCGVCQHAAMSAEQYQDIYADKGVIWVTILLENYYGQVPTLADIQEWAMVFGLEDAVVLAGNIGLLDPTSQKGWYISSLPLFLVIDRDMTTTYRLDGYSEPQIQQWVDIMLAAEKY